VSPGAAMSPRERAALDEANRLRLMTARLTRECERLRADLDTAESLNAAQRSNAARRAVPPDDQVRRLLALALDAIDGLTNGHSTTDAVASAIVRAQSSGTCDLGKVCGLCDCFASLDGGEARDRLMRSVARELLTLGRDLRS
jgi:hypothetical protein